MTDPLAAAPVADAALRVKDAPTGLEYWGG